MTQNSESTDRKTVRGVVKVEVMANVPVNASEQFIRLALRRRVDGGFPDKVLVTDWGENSE